jgi:hypothetical protein
MLLLENATPGPVKRFCIVNPNLGSADWLLKDGCSLSHMCNSKFLWTILKPVAHIEDDFLYDWASFAKFEKLTTVDSQLILDGCILFFHSYNGISWLFVKVVSKWRHVTIMSDTFRK